MDAFRTRFRSLLEWLVAAAVIAAIVLGGSLVVRDLVSIDPIAPVRASEPDVSPAPDVPAGVPSRAVSVPVLPLAGGAEIRVGQPVGAVTARLGDIPFVLTEEVDRGRGRERITRTYTYAGKPFVLVFEPPDEGMEPHLAAIYLW